MMGLEEDMLNAFKYASFSGQADPIKMMRTILAKLERMMLERMLAQINARLKVLSTEGKGDESMDPFIILGVNEHSTKEEVTRAYRKKAFEVHPDKNEDKKSAHEEMAKVNAAYEAIFIYKGWAR